MDFEQTDLLGYPLFVPSPELVQALACPDLVSRLACVRLMFVLSPILRGDGESGGSSVLIDAIPAVFPYKMDQNSRGAYAALAGVIEVPMLDQLDISRPSVSEIKAEMCRIAQDAVMRFEAAAVRLRKVGECSHE